MKKHSSTARASVIDHPTFERDMSSKAIINKNHNEYVKRLAYKTEKNKKEKELQDLRAEVENLKQLVNSLIVSKLQ